MTAAWLLSWWNLIFIVPFFLALVYLGVYTLSGWSFGDDFGGDHDLGTDHDLAVDHDADVDHDIDHDADVDADADAHLDADADADAHADADADADHDADHDADGHGSGRSPQMTLLLWLGLGRVPMGLVLMVLLLSWGAIGFMTNNVVRPLVPADWMVSLASLPLALFGSMATTRTVTRVVGKYMPISETSVKRRDQLLGAVGEAIFAIDQTFGMASVRDKGSGMFHVRCRMSADHEPVAKGSAVLLVGYDAKDGLYTVIPYELGGDSAKALAAGNGNGKARIL